MDGYRLGQLVACIDDNLYFTGLCPDGMTLPRKGAVYRIRTIEAFRVPDGRHLLFLRFDEIRNPEYPSSIGPYEPVFDARAFKPLDDRRIDVFRRAFAPIVRRVDVVPA
ncbi:hypothetical protein EN742_00690 [Mesorhizobium sp. M4A.F.Ca.ET.020.02.1.1]|uniref:hypothetical protein n=1 Tax=Mesorhizobium sp. M4A.F.Ca.ET.020.02.1.1 TaxID=2496652 RepID=UPI000FD35CCD|nr:hypothetical protein [Mesorhizobium sp. M4A.F.Ca.ET.020.02.1.1]RVD44895.1 hypothetical protein EN742_00690 [Mesorhizobium sp. M4A.F.Ca.ET.020.02.1.1]